MFGILNRVLGTVVRRKRNARWGTSLGVMPEVLEERALLACLEIGDYTSPGTAETGPLTLHVNGENEDGDRFAFLTNGDFNIRMRLKCKKNGDIILKCATTKGGPKGTILGVESEGNFYYESHLRGSESPNVGSGTFTPTNN